MNPKDEIVEVFEGRHEGASPPAILTQTGTVGMMEASGSHWPEANFDAEKMVRLALQPSRSFGLGTARIPFDITAEAQTLGCDVYEGRVDSQPAVTGSPWRGDSMEISPVPDVLPSVDEFLSGDRIRTMIDAAEKLHAHEDVFVTAMCVCPGMVVAHILGMENMLLGMVTDAAGIIQWIKRMTPYSRAYAKELSKVTDNVMVIADLSTDLAPADLIDRYIRYDKEVVSSIKGCFSTVHNCGNTLNTVDQLISLDADMLSLETSKDPMMYLEKVNGRSKMIGCINTVRTLLGGTPETVLRECIRSNELGFDLIGPECGVPPRTPDENLRAIAQYRSRL